jgi:hypothetical protein
MMYQLLTGRFPFWDNVKDCTLQQVWKAILTDRIDFNAAELKQVGGGGREGAWGGGEGLWREYVCGEVEEPPWVIHALQGTSTVVPLLAWRSRVRSRR